MSQARKQLKIVSFVQVVVAVILLVTGIGLVVANSSTPNTLAGCAAVLAAVLTCAAAFQGIKGANVPSKLGPHTSLNVAGLICAGASAGVILATSSTGELANTVAACLAFVLNVVSIAFGSRVHKELDR